MVDERQEQLQPSEQDFASMPHDAYLQRVFKIFDEFWHDPLSKTTRERQRQVLFCSILTLLSSLTVVEPTSVFTVMGLKFSVNSPAYLQVIFASATIYLLVLFYVSALPEVRLDTLKRGRTMLIITAIGEELQFSWKARLGRVTANRERTSILLKQAEELRDRLHNNRMATVEAPSDEVRARRHQNEPERIALEKALRETWDEIRRLGDEDFVIAASGQEPKRMEVLGVNVKRAEFHRSMRNWVEIVAPIVFGSGAILRSLWRIWHLRLWEIRAPSGAGLLPPPWL